MNKTIYVVVREMEEAEDFQVVEVLQRRAFTKETDANTFRDNCNSDFGGGFSVVPLTVE